MIAHSDPYPAYAPRSGRSFANAAAGLLLAVAAAAVVLAAVASRVPGSVGGPVASETATPTAEVTASATPVDDAHSGPWPTPPIEPSASASETASPSLSSQETPSAEDTQAARDFLDRYLANLVAGRYADAYAMLAPSMASQGSLATFTRNQTEWFHANGGRYTITAWPKGVIPIADWIAPNASPYDMTSIDLRHAVLLEVDYPALAGNNAGWEMYIVNRTASGSLEIYQVR